MPLPRPRGTGYATGVASVRPSPNTPMSERQQMALLIQMTATPTPDVSRPQLKKNDHKKCEDTEESSPNERQDGSEFKDKTPAEELSPENKKEASSDHGNVSDSSSANICKRHFSDMDDDDYEDCDDVKKKKRKDSDNNKESKILPNLRLPTKAEKNLKQTSISKSSPTPNKPSIVALDKEQCEQVKSTLTKPTESECDDDEFKIAENIYSEGLKVPPLKIVIPQQNCSIDTDGNISRSGKINASRNAALPYVVSSNNDSSEREIITQCNSPHESPTKSNTSICSVIDEKNIKLLNEEKNLHRVLRSSHRSGVTSFERSSNNSSPQMQSSSPSPASLNATEVMEGKICFANTTSPTQHNQTYDHENIVNLPSPSTSSTSSSKETQSSIAELHPRKRKIRSKNDESNMKASTSSGNPSSELSSSISDSHTHDYPFTNCFQMYLNIRRQIEKKWKNLDPIKPRPPQGFSEYLINKRTYLLSHNKEKTTTVNIPKTISSKMKEIFLIQQKERSDLFQRHTVEREKLCLNVEQEIIRIHSKAARSISCQSVPYSACTLLKDEEVYNVITPDQEDKDRNARFRFNGRLLISWLQDVDDKWEKIKESMVLRHHNEAESLHAVQLMDWEIALKKYQLCDYKSQLQVEKEHVPIVHVNDDFDLLPA